jgi:predicted dehydrogenase
MIDNIIKSGVIGEVTSLTANLSYELDGVERLWTPELAGGALLDLGVYTINFSRMVFGENMTDISASAVFKNGVDMTDSITMVFDGDKVATTQTSAYAAGDRRGAIFGTKGFIEVTNINNPEEIKVFDMEYKEIASYLPPKQITGYEYEVEACERAIANGDLECPEMPHAETIKILEIMEDIRRSWGYEIPER